MTKLTKEQITEIIKEYSEGKSQRELGLKFGVSQATITYHTSDKYKEKSKERSRNHFKELYEKAPEQRKEYSESRKAYMRNYMKNRYHNDEVFRKRIISTNILINKKNRAKKRKKRNGS